MAPHETHNALVPELLARIVKGTDGEVHGMIVLESLVLGVLQYYRPDPRAAAEFLDAMHVAVLDRLNSRPENAGAPAQ